MTEFLSISTKDFPAVSSERIRAKWAPVYLEVIPASGERLVVGVMAFSDIESVLVSANKLSRLNCLYGSAATNLSIVIRAALDHLEDEVGVHGAEIVNNDAPITGMSFGKLSDGAGASCAAIAESWLGTLSSLHSRRDLGEIVEVARSVAAFDEQVPNNDRLPTLIAKQVLEIRPGFRQNFRHEILPDQLRSRNRSAHKIAIDYSGSHLVANFCTLYGTSPARASKDIKNRLWDLRVNRDSIERLPGLERSHELMVFRPSNEDPSYSEIQLKNVEEVLGELEEQADLEEIRLRPLTSVQSMVDRVINAETAA